MLIELVTAGDVILTYNRKKVARLTKYQDAPAEPQQPTPPSSSVPADLLDLRNWTLMLPTGSPGDPDSTYPLRKTIPDVFFVRDGGVVLKTPVTGVHSSGSKYPRTELREMKDASWGKAAWSNASGTHTLEARLSVNHTLKVKPEVSVLQIHGGDDDICQVRIARTIASKSGGMTETSAYCWIRTTNWVRLRTSRSSRLTRKSKSTTKGSSRRSSRSMAAAGTSRLETICSHGRKPVRRPARGVK
jgi:hypothetical protein